MHKMSRLSNDWDTYKNLRNAVTNKVRKKKSEYFTSAIENNKDNSSLLWKKLKEILPNKQKCVPSSIISSNGEYVDDPTDIANNFNEYFSTIGERMAENQVQMRPIILTTFLLLLRQNTNIVLFLVSQKSLFKNKLRHCRLVKQQAQMVLA